MFKFMLGNCLLFGALVGGCAGRTNDGGHMGNLGGGPASGGATTSGGTAGGGSTWLGPSGIQTAPLVANGYFTNGIFAGYGFNWLANTTAASNISPDCASNTQCYAGQSSLCATGALEVSSNFAATAGLGFALKQAPEPNAPASDWAPTGDGLYVQLSGITNNLRLQLRALGGDADETKRWCAPVPKGGIGVIPWTSFNSRCWDNSGNYFTPSTPIRWIEITDPSSNAATTPIDVCIVNVTPYVTPMDAGLGASESSEITCSDWSRFTIPGTNNVLVNNVWNKQHAGTYAYHQCLTERPLGGATQYGWSWDWASCDTSTSYAAPEVVFGRKPWDGGVSSSPDLPKRIDAIQSLSLDFGVTTSASLCYNLNSTMWLTKTESGPVAADPENITTEVMVRFEDPAKIPGCCSSDGSVTLEGLTFDVWHQSGHADASDASAYTWNMVTYISRSSVQSTQFDLSLVLRDMVSRGLAEPSYGVQGVELITEISGGAGSLWLDRFSVAVR